MWCLEQNRPGESVAGLKGQSSNPGRSHCICDATAALLFDLKEAGISLREKPVADITGESSNSPDALFETLADWEEQLKHADVSILEMEP